MNYIENERGEFVLALGAPGSLARYKEEFPETWGRHLPEEIVQRIVEGSNPTHRCPYWSGMIPLTDPPTGYTPAWYLGSIQRGERTEYHYAQWSERVPRYVVRFMDYEELPPFNVKDGRPEPL